MKKLNSLVLAALLLGACSNDEQTLQDEQETLELEEVKEMLKVTTDETYVAELKNENAILNVEYSIMEELEIAMLRVTVDETVTVEQAKELALEQETKILEEYPNFLPTVTIVQNETELYTTEIEE